MKNLSFLVAVIIAIALVGCASAANGEGGIGFPKDAGIVNVKSYGAVGDGKADDTQAILSAINADVGDGNSSFWLTKIIFFPDGVYRVTDSLVRKTKEGKFSSGMVLMGESRKGAIIQLGNAAAGFQDKNAPKAVVFTSARLRDGTASSGGKDYTRKGEGNDAYYNFIERLTIDVGKNNPGAIGLDYLANNVGAVRDVAIRSDNSSGAIGLSMDRKWPGPALISNVLVSGFDVGISVSSTEYSMTMADIEIENVKKVGLLNRGNSLAIENMVIRNAPLAISNTLVEGIIIAENLKIQAKGADEAIENRGYFTLKNASVDGYNSLFGVPKKGDSLSGSAEGRMAFNPLKEMWNSTPERLPTIAEEPVERWVNVVKFGADPSGQSDSTAAIRRALDAGGSTVYFPHGSYTVTDSVSIPPQVTRIEGMFSSITVGVKNRNPRFDRSAGIFRTTTSIHPVLIQRLGFDMTNRGPQLAIDHSGGRPLILQDIFTGGPTLVNRSVTGGRLYIENVCCGGIAVAGPAKVIARQLNSEGGSTRIVNRGAPLRVLGLKVEGNVTALLNDDGAESDILGGLVYIVHPPNKFVPAFINRNGKMYLSFAESSYLPNSSYKTYVQQKSENGLEDVPAVEFPRRGAAHMMPGKSFTAK